MDGAGGVIAVLVSRGARTIRGELAGSICGSECARSPQRWTASLTMASGLLRSLGEAVRSAHALDRQKNPHLFVGATSEILFRENVANLLGCEVNDLSCEPFAAIPHRRIGPRAIYLRADVLRFVGQANDRVTPVPPVAPPGLVPQRRSARRNVKRQLTRALQAAREAGLGAVEIAFEPDGSPVLRTRGVGATESEAVAAEIAEWARGR